MSTTSLMSDNWTEHTIGKSLNDEMLVSAAKMGEEKAFVELWNRHSKKLLRTLLWVTKCSRRRGRRTSGYIPAGVLARGQL